LGSFLLKLARPNLKLRDHLGHFRKRNQRPYLLRLLAEKLGGWHMGTPLIRERRNSQNRTNMSTGNKGQPSSCVDLDQRHHPALRLRNAGNIALRGGETGVASKLLDCHAYRRMGRACVPFGKVFGRECDQRKLIVHKVI
jgi:hypothetical protein